MWKVIPQAQVEVLESLIQVREIIKLKIVLWVHQELNQAQARAEVVKVLQKVIHHHQDQAAQTNQAEDQVLVILLLQEAAQVVQVQAVIHLVAQAEAVEVAHQAVLQAEVVAAVIAEAAEAEDNEHST